MYGGVRLPRWAKDDDLASSLPNLVSLRLYSCSELHEIPSLENLRQLKSLHLSGLPNLEYIENTHATISSGKDSSLLPCLEEIYFSKLPKLKRWWRRSVNGLSDNSVGSRDMQQTSSVSLLRLKMLEMRECPEFTCLLYCPNVEQLDLLNFNGRLQIIVNKGSQELIKEVTSSTSYPSTDFPKLREVFTNNLAWLRSSLPLEALQFLGSLKIRGDKEIESLAELEQVFCACSSSLKSLELSHCPKLRYLLAGLTFLTRLESLYLGGLPITSFADENIDGDGDDDEMPWGSFCQSLQYLQVYGCKELELFPKWFRKLDALSHLVVSKCSASLYERCQILLGKTGPTSDTSLAFQSSRDFISDSLHAPSLSPFQYILLLPEAAVASSTLRSFRRITQALNISEGDDSHHM